MIFFSTGNPLPSGFNAIPKFRSDLLKWVRRWVRTGTVMEKLRHADLDDVNVQQAIKNLDDAFKHSTNAYFSLWVISTSTLFASRYRTYAL